MSSTLGRDGMVLSEGFFSRRSVWEWLFAALVVIGGLYALATYQHAMDGYEKAILVGLMPCVVAMGWFWRPLQVLMLGVAAASLLAIASYQGDLARAEQVFWLKYFLSSQSAILWMSVLFFMSTAFYWMSIVIKGQGAIYSGGNVYVPNNLQYADAPSTSRPANNTQAATETWLEANRNKDFVAIMARENVVLGDHTNGTWRSYVSSWLAHAMNKSREDAGEDGIPNTRKGRDGILNTADDDVLEDDSQWTVQRYTADDLARGLIPAGKSVNDPIPGTGEDIDGDGAYDNTLTIANLDLPAALNTTNWGGTITGSMTFSSIASGAMTRLDGAFYTNHAFAWLTTPSSAINMNGAMVSRNESVIYGGPGLYMNYDARLLGGSNTVLGDLLPKTIAPVIVRDWTTLPNDPHAAVLAGGSTAP